MKKQLLMKTFLVAVSLLVGTSVAWADVEITETYDFGAFITANGAPNLTTSGDEIAQSGTSEKVGNVKVINNLSNNGKTLDLNGRFAVDYQYNAGSQIRFMWRSNANAYQHGLAGNWNSKGTADPKGAARFSVLNLKAGDKITLTYAKQGSKAADPYTCRAGMITAGGSSVAADAALASGTQYTVSADGNLDLYFTNNNFAISKIVIVTTGTENVSAPSMTVTGVSGKGRKITITAGTSDAGNDVTTYYTIDGSEPSKSSSSFTTANKEITIGEGATSETEMTVKAYSVSSTDAASTVASQAVTVGTLVKLAAPAISLSAFTQDGLVYHPTYAFTSNQSGVIGAPAVTYSYQFEGGAKTESTTFVAATSGNIIVTANAEGYDSNATELAIEGGNFIKTYSFDAINDVTVDTSTGTWENQTNVNSVQWTFTDLANCTYALREDITLNTFRYARATTAQTKQGFYARLGAGSIGFALNSGEYIVFSMLGGNNVVAKSPATSQSFVQYSNVRAIDIYSPATVTKTITAAGWATYCSPYALDFTGDIANLSDVYIVTGANANSLELSSVKGGTVPANTGLLLEGTAGDVVIPIAGSSTTNVDANKLVGVTAETELAANGGYVLMGSPSVGFYQNSNAFTVGANTAYLPADFAATARSFYSFGDATAIKAIDNLQFAIDNYYNVAGQRVAAPTKGLYIKNGKKIVVK